MANLPPDTIHVKRKRGTDGDPVDFLRLDSSSIKRSRSDSGWVYQRKIIPDPNDTPSPRAATDLSSHTVPHIQVTRDGDEQRLLKHPGAPAGASPIPSRDATTPGTTPITTTEPLSHPTTDRIRRFHLSRPNSPQPASSGGISKKRSMPAIFVERGAKKQRETLTKALMQEQGAAPESALPPKPAPKPSEATSSVPQQAEQAATDNKKAGIHIPTAASSQQQPPTTTTSPPRKFKRPGTRALSKTKPELPPSMRQAPENAANMDELARIMDDWTLSEIAKNMGKIEEQSTTSKFSPAKPTRFKPKAPAKRYFERHPPPPPQSSQATTTAAAPGTNNNRRASVMDVDSVPDLAPSAECLTDEDSDGDYILDVYERVPAERLHSQDVPAHKVGLLVFDTEPDMVEFFYGNQSESEDEFPEDEDDENAENYYAADYPDEDLDWDDEFDRNPYKYTNQNDSDNEEFDEREFIDEVLERCAEEGEDDDDRYVPPPPGLGRG